MNDLNVSLDGLSAALATLTAQVAAGVVTVHGARRISGVVTGAGQVLTVAHVLTGDEVAVTDADGTVRSAQVAGRDPVSDLALLRVEGLTTTPLIPATDPQVGELSLTVARPNRVQAAFGLLADAGEGGWWRADARPFPGVSGGAVVNTRGELVGVANAGASRGQLLLVPAARAMRVAGLLASQGRVPQGYLGVGTQPVRLRGEGSVRVGLTLVSVEAGSPAESGGLKVGDILLAVEGQRVGRPDALLGFVRERAGQPVSLTLLRGGEEQTLSVTLGER